MKRSGFKKKPTVPMKKTPLKKVSKAPISRIRTKCDKLLTPIVKKKYPKCLLCSNPTQVAHHHVHKSKSNRLRHDLENLINLCSPCHMALHHNESYYASRIIAIKGQKWNEYILKSKQESVQVNRKYYEAKLLELSNLLSN